MRENDPTVNVGLRDDDAASDGEAIPAREHAAVEHVERTPDSDVERDVRLPDVELPVGHAPSEDEAASPERASFNAPSSPDLAFGAPAVAASVESSTEGNAQRDRFRVVLHLNGGDSIDVDAFDDEAAALAAANPLANELSDLRGWPRVGSLFIHPARIVAIEVQEIRMHRESALRSGPLYY